MKNSNQPTNPLIAFNQQGQEAKASSTRSFYFYGRALIVLELLLIGTLLTAMYVLA